MVREGSADCIHSVCNTHVCGWAGAESYWPGRQTWGAKDKGGERKRTGKRSEKEIRDDWNRSERTKDKD